MSEVNIFEFATRHGVRFPGHRGNLSVEDLWDLAPKDLDSIYKGLKAEQKAASEESLLETKNPTERLLGIKIEIVTHIVKTKLADAEAAKVRQANRARKQELLAILADKENEALKSSSADELRRLISELSDD